MLSAFTPAHYFSDIYAHLGVMLYNPSSSPWGPGRNICASLGGLAAEATGMKLALSLLMYALLNPIRQSLPVFIQG